MPWRAAAIRLPHIFEEIFRYLKLKDRLVAAQVCPEWEAAIFNRRELTQQLALNVLRMVGLRQRLISQGEIICSQRRYESIIIAPRGIPYLVWDELIAVLELCNQKYPAKWIRIDGIYDVENKIIVPSALVTFGKIFDSLQHLELTLTLYSYSEAAWSTAFENFSDLKSLTLYNGHGKALESVQRYCRRLTKLKLSRFALTMPLCELLDFPELKELIIDEMDASPHLGLRYGSSRVMFANLKHLTILMAYSAHYEYLELMPAIIEAPFLETAFLTDLIHDFVQVVPGDQFQSLTLNITTFHRDYFLSSRIFRQPVTSVSTVTVETSLLKPVIELALVFVIRQCPQARSLRIQQRVDPYDLTRTRIFASRVVPSLKEITAGKCEFRHRSFCL